MRQFSLMKDGYERVNTEHWRKARFLGYCISKPYFEKEHLNMSVFEFMPLEGDPTEDELNKMRSEYEKEKQIKFEEEVEARYAMYRKMGLLKNIKDN